MRKEKTLLLMKWLVEISEIKGDERLLRDTLGACSILLYDQAGKLFLVGNAFDTLQTAGEVHALASRVKSIIAEIGDADSEIRMSFKIGDVLEEGQTGEVRRYVFLTAHSSARCFATAGAILVVVRGQSLSEADQELIEANEIESAYEKRRRKTISRVVSAFNDERALQVQRLSRSDLTPLTMGHIADLIKDDVGRAMRDFVPCKELTRFYRSINHPKVFGQQARHIVSNNEVPPRPMNIDEARKFILGLVESYLLKKARLSSLP